MSEFVRRAEEVMCERHERLLAFFYELYKAKPIPVQESGIPVQEVIDALSKDDWVKLPHKRFWYYFWNDAREEVHSEEVEEDLEKLHQRGYLYIDKDDKVFLTGRAILLLGAVD